MNSLGLGDNRFTSAVDPSMESLHWENVGLREGTEIHGTFSIVRRRFTMRNAVKGGPPALPPWVVKMAADEKITFFPDRRSGDERRNVQNGWPHLDRSGCGPRLVVNTGSSTTTSAAAKRDKIKFRPARAGRTDAGPAPWIVIELVSTPECESLG